MISQQTTLSEPGNVAEFRIVLPLNTEEYQRGQLYSIAEASKNETGGGEGVEVLKNEDFNETKNVPPWPLLGGRYTRGQYTYKIYKLYNKVPAIIRMLAPRGSLEIHEEAWNAYPFCRTLMTNPVYKTDEFYILVESLHLSDQGETENPHQLTGQRMTMRQIIDIDIAKDDKYPLKQDYDPTSFRSEVTGRGPLLDDWQQASSPVMCCYKLVSVCFKKFLIQNKIESIILKIYRQLFAKFHRQLFCTIDQWHGMTMNDIRQLEEATQEELEQAIKTGKVKGTKIEKEGEEDQPTGTPL